MNGTLAQTTELTKGSISKLLSAGKMMDNTVQLQDLEAHSGHLRNSVLSAYVGLRLRHRQCQA